MAQDVIIPGGKYFYIVYENEKKDSYLTSFLSNSNTTGKGGEREATVRYDKENITTFETFESFNAGLRAVDIPEMTYNPYLEEDPSTFCNQDNDGNCT